MQEKLMTAGRIWVFTLGVSLLTMLASALPGFGGLAGDLEVNCRQLRLPFMSCSLLAAVVTGVWAYRNWRKT